MAATSSRRVSERQFTHLRLPGDIFPAPWGIVPIPRAGSAPAPPLRAGRGAGVLQYYMNKHFENYIKHTCPPSHFVTAGRDV